MSRKILITSMILILGVAALSYAQLPPGKWWKLKDLAKEIELTDRQVNEIEKVFIENKKSMIDLKATLEKERLDLEAMFEKDVLDEDAVTKQIERVEDARSHLHKTQLMFFVKIRKILSTEQFAALREKKKALMEMQREMKKRGDGERKHKRGKNMHNEQAPCPDPPCDDDF